MEEQESTINDAIFSLGELYLRYRKLQQVVAQLQTQIDMLTTQIMSQEQSVEEVENV